jgi:hypothetical protein
MCFGTTAEPALLGRKAVHAAWETGEVPHRHCPRPGHHAS